MNWLEIYPTSSSRLPEKALLKLKHPFVWLNSTGVNIPFLVIKTEKIIAVNHLFSFSC